MWEGWLVVDTHGGGRKFRAPNLKCSWRPDLACLLPTTAHTSIVGTVAQARIRCSVFSCRPHCHSCQWSSHSLLSWRMLWYHVFVLIYLIVFITDCFIRKWCTKRILIPSTFVGSFCLSNWFLYLLVGLLSGCLVGCLVICFLWLVGRSVFAGWLVLHDDVIKWKHFPRNWPFVRGIHRSAVNSPHKGQWRGALIFSLICVWKNGWVNNREAGDLRRNRGHYDVIVMNSFRRLVLVDGSLDRTTIISLLGFTEHALITKAGSPGVSGHRKFETLLIV